MAYAQLLRCFFGSKIYSLREANQSPCNFFRIEGVTKRTRQTDKTRFIADSAILNNVARSDFCCLETAFLRGRSVSLETSFEGFNHKKKIVYPRNIVTSDANYV